MEKFGVAVAGGFVAMASPCPGQAPSVTAASYDSSKKQIRASRETAITKVV